VKPKYFFPFLKFSIEILRGLLRRNRVKSGFNNFLLSIRHVIRQQRLASAEEDTKERIAKKGGEARSDDKDSPRESGRRRATLTIARIPSTYFDAIIDSTSVFFMTQDKNL
jgi:hypothetical protein